MTIRCTNKQSKLPFYIIEELNIGERTTKFQKLVVSQYKKQHFSLYEFRLGNAFVIPREKDFFAIFLNASTVPLYSNNFRDKDSESEIMSNCISIYNKHYT